MSATPFSLVVVLSLLVSIQAFAVRPIRFVKASASSGGDGQSWATAFRHLQDALAAAQAGDDIWVAAGTYFPDAGDGIVNNDRTATFALKTDVAVYGGFNGSNNNFSSRNPATNVTILQGDIANDPLVGNAVHVVTGSGVNDTAILDGFTITNGNADNQAFPDSGGGGFICRFGSPKVVNCIFSANIGLRLGGGIYVDGASTPSFTGCTFIGNSNTDRAGGGVFVSVATATFSNCTFSTNHSEGDGGGLYLQSCTSTLTNCTFTGNTSDRQGGAILIEQSTPALTGCTFTLNTATAKGGAIFADRSVYTLATCSFSQNSSEDGGAVGNFGSSPTATNCTFTQNTATQEGGAMASTTNTSTDPDTHSNPNLANCTFTGNTAHTGGAIFSDGIEGNPATPVVTSCTFTSNTASSTGGAAHFTNCSPQLTGSSFITNSATNSSAGAISFFRVATAAVSGCTFNTNSAPSGGALNLNLGGLFVASSTFSGNSASIAGGAVAMSAPAATDPAALFMTCSFSGNTSAFGGSIDINGSSTDTPTWTNCAFVGNSGTSRAGAVNGNNSSPVFRSCAFSGNSSGSQGAAAYFGNSGSPAFTNCTVSGNSAVQGGALTFNFTNPTLANTIVFNNSGTSGSTTSQNDSLRFDNSATGSFTHSLVANFTKANLDAGASPDTNVEPLDPKFVTPVNPASAPTTAGNLALKTGSPAIDAGSNAAISLTLDLAGNPRVFNAIIDLGALENQGANLFLEDIDGDGISGGVELALGTNPAVSDAENPKHLRILPAGITFGHDPATGPTIALELRRSTNLVSFDVVIASSVTGFPAPGPGGIVTVTDPSPPPGGKAFYRLQATPRAAP